MGRQPLPYGRADAEGLRAGLISALLLAIPIWAGLGLGLVFNVANRRLDMPEGIALAVAAVVELVLLQYAWRTLGWRFGLRPSFAMAGVGPGRGSVWRQSSLLFGIVGAYLHYYFWDVYLQIESMKSVVVFLPLTRTG